VFDWRRPVVLTHRWLGILCGVLFIAWFASGIVMMYARMPALEPDEHAARLPPLDFSSARVSVADAAIYTGGAAQRVRIGMLAGRPAYKLFSAGRWTVVFADTGRPFDALTPDQALDEARRFAPEHSLTMRYDGRLTSPDQWTLESRALLPMHRIALGDQADTYLYLSDQTGEAVLKTTRTSRRLGYAGAVVHWIYFTPLRRNGRLWTELIIWGSIVGVLMCATGIVWGVWQYIRSGLIYSGWMRWHHYAGLIFGVTTLTWIFSGLLSMDPWNWHPGTGPNRQQRDAFSGGMLTIENATPDRLRAALAALAGQVASEAERGVGPPRAERADRGRDPGVKEVELVQFRGQVFLSSDSALVPIAAPDRGARPEFDREALLEAAREAMPGVAVQDAVWLEEYDAYYYDRSRDLPLPILRVRYEDPQRTWLYVDPRRGAIARKEERLTRLNRWLYRGFHSWDFPFLYFRRPLWDVVVIALSVGGLLSATTTLVPAWRRLRRITRPT
jgi:hypothetical protein